MRQRGATAITAVVGPSICPRCYPVPPERVAQVAREVCPEVAAAALHIPGSIHVAAGCIAQLAALDIQHIQVAGCTAESQGLFSYRRDQRTGRQGICARI